MAWWTISVGIDDPDVDAIRTAAVELLDFERAGVITESHADGSDGPSLLSLDLEAGSVAGATSLATSTWNWLRAHAGLVPAPAHIGFVVGPIGEPSVFHDELLAKARGLLLAGRFDHATIAAQTAFEVYIRHLLRDLSRSVMPEPVAAAVQPGSFTLRDRSSGPLLDALIGRRVTESGDLAGVHPASDPSQRRCARGRVGH